MKAAALPMMLITAALLAVPVQPVIASEGFAVLQPLSAKGPTTASVRVAGVAPNSAAEEAGLAAGDTILSVNGKKLRDAGEAHESIRRAPKSSPLALLVGTRDGRRTASVKLRNKPPRLGAQLTGAFLDQEKGVAGFTCPDVAVNASAMRLSNFNVLMLTIFNLSDDPLEFTPQDVTIRSGTRTLSPSEPDEVAARLYADANDAKRQRKGAQSQQGNWLEELLKVGVEQANDDATRGLAKNAYDQALEDVTLEKDQTHQFMIYALDQTPTWPLTLKVNVRGKEIAFRFVGPSEAPAPAIQPNRPRTEGAPAPEQERSPGLDEWYGRLTPARLMKFQAYSTNSGGQFAASNSETRIDLCADGSFTFHSQRSTTLSGDGSVEDSGGRWSLREQDGQPLLVLAYEDGNTTEFTLVLGNGGILMNGAKWLKAQQGENGPACQ